MAFDSDAEPDWLPNSSIWHPDRSEFQIMKTLVENIAKRLAEAWRSPDCRDGP
jgi:hypothetical protein